LFETLLVPLVHLHVPMDPVTRVDPHQPARAPLHAPQVTGSIGRPRRCSTPWQTIGVDWATHRSNQPTGHRGGGATATDTEIARSRLGVTPRKHQTLAGTCAQTCFPATARFDSRVHFRQTARQHTATEKISFGWPIRTSRSHSRRAGIQQQQCSQPEHEAMGPWKPHFVGAMRVDGRFR
jgi:hypothetical protein